MGWTSSPAIQLICDDLSSRRLVLNKPMFGLFFGDMDAFLQAATSSSFVVLCGTWFHAHQQSNNTFAVQTILVAPYLLTFQLNLTHLIRDDFELCDDIDDALVHSFEVLIIS